TFKVLWAKRLDRECRWDSPSASSLRAVNLSLLYDAIVEDLSTASCLLHRSSLFTEALNDRPCQIDT
ncbi:hypothetical protein P7K49_007527, partial [Saguinus oedipus]